MDTQGSKIQLKYQNHFRSTKGFEDKENSVNNFKLKKTMMFLPQYSSMKNMYVCSGLSLSRIPKGPSNLFETERSYRVLEIESLM